MIAVPVAAMHEQVYQRAGQQEQIRPVGKQSGKMCPMFGYQKISTDGQKDDTSDIGLRIHRTVIRSMLVFHINSSGLSVLVQGILFKCSRTRRTLLSECLGW